MFIVKRIYKHTLVTIYGGNFYDSGNTMCRFKDRYTAAEYSLHLSPLNKGGFLVQIRSRFVNWKRDVEIVRDHVSPSELRCYKPYYDSAEVGVSVTVKVTITENIGGLIASCFLLTGSLD